jgi:hypothetical protein
MSAPMAHAVPGAGGVGGTIGGACLAHLGDSVTLVVRRDELAQSPRTLHFESTLGNFDENVSRLLRCLRAAEQDLPNLLRGFEHEHLGSGIHLCTSQAITKKSFCAGDPYERMVRTQNRCRRKLARLPLLLPEARNRG